jgi:DNA-directed RNA polymerase subunit M/transcription elongation factor TFIIS
MVVIECPHCDEELEMDDDAYGLFECPYCQNEYQWGEAPRMKRKKRKLNTHSKVSTNSKITNTKQKKSRTKPLDSKTKLFERRRQTTNHKEMDTLGYGGIQVSSLFATFAMLMLIFTGLNSDSWYTADWWEEYDYEEKEYRGLSEDTGSGSTMSFGTSGVLIESVRDTKTYNYGDSAKDGEEYQDISYSGVDYGSIMAQISASISEQKEYCKDRDNAGWGQTGDEFEAECRDSLDDLNDQYDWYNSWDKAGTSISFVMIISLIFCLLVFSIKAVLLLHQLGVISNNKNLLTKITFWDNILSSILGGILIIGLIIYWSLVPDFNHIFRLQGGYEPDDYSYGLGMIWWLTMIYSFIYIAISVAGMGKNSQVA